MLHDRGVSAEYDICQWRNVFGYRLFCEGEGEDSAENVLYNDDDDDPNVRYISLGTPLAYSDQEFYLNDEIQLPSQRAIIMDTCNYRGSDDSFDNCNDASDDMKNMREGASDGWYMDDDAGGYFAVDDIAGGMTFSFKDSYKTIFSTIGYEAIKGTETRRDIMRNSINYLAGPRTFDTTLYSGQSNIPGTEVDERRYVNESVYFEGRCRNTQRNSDWNDISTMEWAYSSSGLDDRSSYSSSGNMDNTDEEDNNEALFGYKNKDFNLKSPPPGGINFTGGIHCQDSSTNGYWGQFQKRWFKVDQIAPRQPLRLEPSRQYIPDGNAVLNVSYVDRNDEGQQLIEDRQGYRYDLVRFRCQGASEWGSWREYNDSRLYQEYSFNASGGACSWEGQQTIEVQGRDYAGNFDSIRSLTVTVDRTPPALTVDPGNRNSETLITNTTDIKVDVSDNEAVSQGQVAPENTYNNQTGEFSFTPGTRFDPGFSQGDNLLEVTAYDKAGNQKQLEIDYFVDVSPPEISTIDPGNNSFIRQNEQVDLEISENRQYNETVFQTVNGNTTVEESSEPSFDHSWTSTGERWLGIWLEDVAGNRVFRNYTYKVDVNDPVLNSKDPSDGAYINNQTSLEFSFSDDTGIKNSRFYNGTDNISVVSGEGFNPGFSQAGQVSGTLFLNDSADNTLKSEFSYTLDESPPTASTNYSYDGWLNGEVAVNLSAEDNNGLEAIRWGTSGQLDSPSLENTYDSSSTLNYTTVVLSCSTTCVKTLDYRAEDLSGLFSSSGIESSENVSIDNEAPDASIESPSDGGTESGTVTFDVSIDDSPGVGIKEKRYNISRLSNGEQVDAGPISGSSFQWDSGSYNDDFKIDIYTWDGFDQSTNDSITITVDNNDVTTQVREPSEDFLNRSLDVLLEANNPTGNPLDYHNYTVNSSSGLVDSGNFTFSTKTSNKIQSINVSNITEGDVTIRSFAGSGDVSASDSFTFKLDTTPPDVSIDSPSNESWQTGSIDIGYTVSDNNNNGVYSYNVSGAGSTSGTLERDGGPLDFNTEICNDTADPECVLELTGIDEAGNNASDLVFLKVDNSPPSTEFNFPSAGSWQNSEFQVERQDSDNVAETLSCSWSNGTETFTAASCASGFDVNLSVCGEQGSNSCTLTLNVENDVGLTDSSTRRFSIDYTPPEVISRRFDDGEIINDTQDLSFTVEDDYSTTDNLEYDSGSGWQQLTSGQLFDPGWDTSGNRQIDIRGSDIAGNDFQNSYVYQIDADKPSIEEFGIRSRDQSSRRIYPGEQVLFDLNATDSTSVRDRRLILDTPSGTETIRFLTGNRTTYNAEEYGDHQIEWIFLRDEGLNTANYSDYSGFTSIDIGSNSTFNNSRTTGAAEEGVFNISIDFNRSTGGDAVIQIPEYSENGIRSFDISGEKCYNCSLQEDRVSSDSRYATLSFNSTSPTPLEDTSRNITVRTDYLPENSTRVTVKPPVIGLDPDRESFQVGQFQEIDISGTLTNLGNGSYPNLTVDAFSGELDYTNSSAKSRLGAGESSSFSFRENFTEVGNYTINLLGSDDQGYYENSSQIELEILDTEEPEIVDVSIEDRKIRKNSQTNLTAEITDNTEVENVSVTLDSPQGVENLSLAESPGEWFLNHTETSSTGFYNFTDIYANDSRGNTVSAELDDSFEVVDTQLQVSASNFSVPETSLEAEVLENASRVRTVSVNITKPDGKFELVELGKDGSRFTGNYTNLTQSGSYELKFTAETSNPISNTLNKDAPQGDALARFDDDSIALAKDASPYQLEWIMEAVSGDAESVYVDFQTDDSSVLSPTGSNPRNIGAVDYVNPVSFSQGFESSSIGTTQLTVTTNDSEDDIRQETFDVTVTEDDSESPEINQINFSESVPNAEEEFQVTANVTDNTLIDGVNATVTGDSRSATEMAKKDGVYMANISVSETGEQNITVEAEDISGNSASRNSSVTVSDNISVSVEPVKDIFVRGERIQFNISTSDANGEKLEGYSSRIQVDKNGSSTVTVESESDYAIADTEDPPTEQTDPNLVPATYTADLRVNWNGRTETDSVEFPVTRLLDIEWVAPTGSLEPGETFTVSTRWRRPDGSSIRPTSTVYSICEECDSEYKMMSTSDQTSIYSQRFTAPNQTGQITIQAFARNRWNSESQAELDSPPTQAIDLGIDNDDQTDSGSGGGGGGGFGGGGGPPALSIERLSPEPQVESEGDINLSISTSQSAECRYSRNSIYDSIGFREATVFDRTNSTYHEATLQVSDGTYRYSVACDSGLSNSSSEIVFTKGESVEGFNLFTPSTMTPGNESALQSDNVTEPFTVLNNGTEEIEIDVSVESGCCRSWVTQDDSIRDSITIEPGSENRYILKTYVPLNAEEGTHNLLLQMEGPVSRQKSMSFQVSNNREMRRLGELRDAADTLKWRIGNFDSAGIETGAMNRSYGELLSDIEMANRSVRADDIEGLRNATRQGYIQVEEIENLLEEQEVLKYWLLNWWKWALGFVLTYVTFFLITMVAIPYYRLKTQLLSVKRRLRNAVEARKKSEKQYFRREIDRDTFNRMMRERQNQVLELRGEKEDLQEEMNSFWRNQLTVQNYLRAPIKASEELARWWQANQEARESLKGEDEDE